jgi:CBS domain-containing protein
VNVVHRMFRRHLPGDFRFVCITDDPGKYDEGVDVMSTPPEALALAHLRTPEGDMFPSCYRRLWMFSDAARCLGDRVLLVDIDILVIGDASRLFAPEGDFVGWKPTASWGHNNRRVGGGLYLMTPGTKTEVWEDFKGAESIALARKAGYRGSDQAWISYKLWGCPLFPKDAGIYSIRDLRRAMKPPADAVLIQHNGSTKPWASRVPWVRDAWG